MARPLEKDGVIRFRLPSETKRVFLAAAKTEGLSLTDWLTRVGVDRAVEVTADPELGKQMQDAFEEIVTAEVATVASEGGAAITLVEAEPHTVAGTVATVQLPAETPPLLPEAEATSDISEPASSGPAVAAPASPVEAEAEEGGDKTPAQIPLVECVVDDTPLAPHLTSCPDGNPRCDGTDLIHGDWCAPKPFMPAVAVEPETTWQEHAAEHDRTQALEHPTVDLGF